MGVKLRVNAHQHKVMSEFVHVYVRACVFFTVLQVISVGLESEIENSFMQYAMSIILVSKYPCRTFFLVPKSNLTDAFW